MVYIGIVGIIYVYDIIFLLCKKYLVCFGIIWYTTSKKSQGCDFGAVEKPLFGNVSLSHWNPTSVKYLARMRFLFYKVPISVGVPVVIKQCVYHIKTTGVIPNMIFLTPRPPSCGGCYIDGDV